MSERKDIDIAAMKARLEEMKAELETLANEHEHDSDVVQLDQTTQGRLSRMDALQGQAMAQEVARRREAEIKRIDVALKRIEPKYTASEVPEGGYVVLLNVMVTKRGKVTRVSVEEGNPQSQLVAAAIDAVLRSEYRPATQDGEPIKAWTLERFEYGN